jgi:hypothetical protein
MRLIKPIATNPNKRKKYELIFNNPKLIADIKLIRSKYNIDPIEVNELNIDDYLRIIEDFKLIKETKLLLKRYKLNEEFFDYIHEYIVNDHTWNVSKGKGEIYFEQRFNDDGDKYTGKPKYFIQIFPDTTIRDIQKAWNEIKKTINFQDVKNRGWIYFERDKYITEELHFKMKLKAKEIMPIIAKKYGILDESHIRTIISNYIKRTGLNKKSRR